MSVSIKPNRWWVFFFILAGGAWMWPWLSAEGEATLPTAGVSDPWLGRPVDIASSAYGYRADRRAEDNPPESWVLLMQYAGLPYTEPVSTSAPAIKQVLAGLLWEEVRPLRLVELSWGSEARSPPSPDELAVYYFDSTDNTAHTWWNPRTVKEASKPTITGNGRTYDYSIPVDTWGVVVAARGPKESSSFSIPTLKAFVPDVWKRMDLEIEWGFEPAKAGLEFDGQLEVYDTILDGTRPLPGDTGTTMTGTNAWRSIRKSSGRRGLQLSAWYMGTSRWRRVWPYHAQPEDVARSIVTVWTKAGSFSFQISDLEQGPILAPEFGFFVRATAFRKAVDGAEAAVSDVAPSMQLLSEPTAAFQGVPGVRGWSLGGMPWFGVNSRNEPGKAGSLTIPARCVTMHPSPSQDVAVGWRSLIQGTVSVSGRVAMCDAVGGNGIDWGIVREREGTRQMLAHGSVLTGGSGMIPASGGATNLTAISVRPGEVLALVVGAKDGNHFCDTTTVEFQVTEIGEAKRQWNLARDVVDSIQDGNPHADGLGNPEVWRFYAATARPLVSPSPSEPPFRMASTAASAEDFLKELTGKGLKTIRQRVREHPEQTWEESVAAMHPGEALPPHPQPAFEPPMQLDLPSERLTAQWKLGAWHILRRTEKDAHGRWRFNDYPFGVLASETYMILRALDLQGMHTAAADGLDQWLGLPLQPRVKPGAGGHHAWALADRPLGHFADGLGCLTHAEGAPGVGGHMDGVHCMGPGAIMFSLLEHFRLTGDTNWLKVHAPRIEANVQWILRQRQVLSGNLPGAESLWSKGLQPAQVVTPDSERMQMQYYETEAYYWLGVRGMADLLKVVQPDEGEKILAAAEAYRQDLRRAINRSITLTPVVPVRDGTYHSFIPFAPYVRGFAAGAWGWRRCQGHVGAIYWDTVQSADPLISPSGLLSPQDPRVQGHLDVLEDRLLLENTKVNLRTSGYVPEKDWFSHASWQYQCGLERHANIHLAADDAPNFIRSMLNQYAVDIMPGEYTFREHTTGGPPDKIYEESCFLERLRQMLIMEEEDTLWLGRAIPRAWLEPGKRISIKNAPTHFGPVAYELIGGATEITGCVDLPVRQAPGTVLLRLRHPKAMPMVNVEVNGRAWTGFNPRSEVVHLEGLSGRIDFRVRY